MRTRLQNLKHILKQYTKGNLGANVAGACYYEHNGKNCGVGCMFSAAQIRDLKARGLNGMSIEYVTAEIGEKNIEAVTGMSLDELGTMQAHHDTATARIGTGHPDTDFYRYVTRLLDAEQAKKG